LLIGFASFDYMPSYFMMIDYHYAIIYLFRHFVLLSLFIELL